MSTTVEELSPNYLTTGPSGRSLSCVVLKFQLSLDLILLQWILLFFTHIYLDILGCEEEWTRGPITPVLPKLFCEQISWRGYQNTPSNPEDLGRSLEFCIF